MADVAVIGGGIVGCAAAAYLAEAGLSVTLHERAEVAAGASGRNSGVLQDPFDPVLRPLYDASLAEYAQLEGFALPPAAGLLMLAEDPVDLAGEWAALQRDRLDAAWLEGAELRAAEPSLADGLAAIRLETGHPVPPAAATRAFADRARRAGATVHEHAPAPRVGSDPSRGGAFDADAVLVCAGPWTPEVSGVPLPITPVWGVVAEVRLPAPPRHVVEEAGVERIAAEPEAVPSVFSLVTAAGGASSLGSTFLREEPDPAALAPGLRERGARFVPALADVEIGATRACARPQSADGRPFLGRAGDVWIAAGHGPWGVSLGPGSARLVVDAMLGRQAVPDALRADRVIDR